MFQRGWFLVEAANPRLSKQIVRSVQRYGVVRASAADEIASHLLCGESRVAGAVVAVAADKVGSVVARLRAQSPSLPILALLQQPSIQAINRLQTESVEVACLPLHLPSVVSFTQRALSVACIPHQGIGRTVAQLAREHGLTPREVQLLAYALADDPRGRVRKRLGVEENTLKTQIRSLLRKCQARNLDALAKNVLRSALLEKLGTATARPAAQPRMALVQSA